MKYRECRHCGASLDFGEKCNCREQKENKEKILSELFKQESNGQFNISECLKVNKNKETNK